MTDPYVYTDPDGDQLEVLPCRGTGVKLFAQDATTGDCACIFVHSKALPALVAEMYRAAGLNVPVLVDPDEVADGWVRVPGKAGAP